MTETSFSWNFDAGTLTDAAAVKSLQENSKDGSGYGLPLSGCLPGSHEPVQASEPRPEQLHGSESEKLLGDKSDNKVMCSALTIATYAYIAYSACKVQ